MPDAIDQIVSNWPNDRPFDTHAAISQWHGEPLTESQIACLAIIEYLESHESPGALPLDAFIDKFPNCRDELIHRLGRMAGDEERHFSKINEILFGQLVIRYLSITRDTQVYLTQDLALDGRVNVLKVSRRKTLESHFLAKLSHPNVVTLFSAISPASVDECGIVVEYCGESQLLNEPAASRLQRLAAIASGVEYLHSHGVIHNDLTDRNIVMSKNINKIIDFDASVPIGEHGTSRPIGTAAYLTRQSLEELLACERFISPCDVSIDRFAFAVLCYKVLTGTLPWDEHVQTDAEGLQGVLSARKVLHPRNLDKKVLSAAQRCLFCSVFQESKPAPTPMQFVRAIEKARNTKKVKFLSAIASFLVASGLIVWAATDHLSAVRQLGAAGSELSHLEEVREEIASPFERDDVNGVLLACSRYKASLSPQEKAVLAYALGMSRADSTAEIIYGQAAVQSGCADAAVYSNLACAYLKRAEVNAGLAELDKAQRIDPSCPQSAFLRALAYSKMKRFEPLASLDAVNKALRLLPTQTAVQNLAIEILAKFEASEDRSVVAIRLSRELSDQLRALEYERRDTSFSLYAKPYSSQATRKTLLDRASPTSGTRASTAKSPAQSGLNH